MGGALRDDESERRNRDEPRDQVPVLFKHEELAAATALGSAKTARDAIETQL